MIRIFAYLILFFTATLIHAQVDIAVPPQVKNRMETALREALATRPPSWCTTADLMSQRNIVIEKCMKTLYHNYQPVNGAIHHEGIVPSPASFNGLWAWDSWKHAYALARFDKELAENSLRAMFDYQNAAGMVADCIFVDSTENNYRDTKPPLAAWAVFEIFLQTNDTSFVREIFPKLLKYHAWWYTDRDHDKNGLCEYGCVDSTLEASRWESGWDNAIRFDSAGILKNGTAAFSMNIESVDLNAYLCIEKEALAQLATLIGETASASSLQFERKKLGKEMKKMLYDSVGGFFYDVRVEDKSFVRSKEASGWLPLYAGVATTREAGKVKEMMLNEQSFNTYVPLPTASRDNPGFSPSNGYWRGPVWIDQFYFGYEGLKRYGYADEADALLRKLLKNGEGITDPKTPLRENYDPLTGKGLGAEMFGWTAAHLLLMMIEE